MNSKIRTIAMEEWRGISQAEPKPDRARPVGEIMKAVLSNLGLKDRLIESEVISAWTEIVGDFIASHSVPSRLQAGVLYVQVLQPTVHYELDRVWKPEILKKFKQRFGARTIREIRFRVG